MHQRDFMRGRFDARLRLLLERVDHPRVVVQQDRINDSVGVTPEAQRQLEDTGAEALQGLCDIRMAAPGDDGQRAEQLVLRSGREVLEILFGRA